MPDAAPQRTDVQALPARHAPAGHAALADVGFPGIPDGDAAAVCHVLLAFDLVSKPVVWFEGMGETPMFAVVK